MAFDCSPQNLRKAVEEEAVPFAKLHTQMADKIVRRYAGPNYRKDWGGDDSGDNKEAHEFEHTVNAVPSLIHNNPAVKTKGFIPGVDDEVQAILDAVYPQWIESVDLCGCISPVAYDMQFGFGVVMVGVDVLPGYEQMPEPRPLMPMVYRISPRRFFIDPQATSFDTARYMGHVWIQDKDDLLAEVGPDGQSKFDPVAVEEMGVDTDLDKADAKVQKDGGFKTDRKQVVGYEIWVRESNKVYTLGATRGDKFLRPERPFGGCPKLGPYTLFGIYCVPDQILPLPVLAVTCGLVDELNAHRAQAADSAAAAKTLIFVDSQNKQAKVAVVSGSNGTVHTVPGLGTGGVQRVDLMGPSKDQMGYIAELSAHLNQVSGLNQTQRGELTGSTAEEAALASQATSARTLYAQKQFRAPVARVIKQAGHFIIFNEDVAMIIGVNDPVTGQKIAMKYHGGMQQASDPNRPETFRMAPHPETGQWAMQPMPAQDPAAYDRLNIEIEPNSMELTDQGMLQRQMMNVMTAAETTAPMMQATPWWNWTALWDDFGATMNMKDLGKKYIDAGTLQGAQQAMVMQEALAAAGDQQGMAHGDQQAQQGQEAHDKAMKEPPGTKGSQGPPKQRKKPAGAKA